MPPVRPRAAPDDSRSEASSTREKFGNTTGPNVTSKGRRTASGLAPTSSLREYTNTGELSMGVSAGPPGPGGLDLSTGIQWTTFDTSELHAYRHAYRLNTPAAFKNPHNHIILSNTPIGRLSPTMARRRDQRRQSKEQLSTAIRKHFNGLGIQENEVVVDFLYKVKWQDKNFRLRFAPHQPR